MISRSILKRAGEIAYWIAVAVPIFAVLMSATVMTRSSETCSLCRAERMNSTFCGIPWRTYRDTEFTEWHRAHRPEHQHVWGWWSCESGFSILGIQTYVACGSRHPICGLPSRELRRFVERADAETLTAFFDGITSTDLESQQRAVELAWEALLKNK